LKIFANENIAASVIRALRERGHDVLSVKESMRGASDKEILACAQDEGRLVVTHDKDFGELAFRWGLPAQCGIILLRTIGSNPESTRKRVLELIEARSDWAGHFAVVTDRHIKFPLLPALRREKLPQELI
jgi:predicted nuclease of predicted toxin-antitoxin system